MENHPIGGSGYGAHPTPYGGLSDMDLYALYCGENWSKLNEAHRQQLLQETVNRAARENGENGSCRVVFADLGPRVAGEQSGDTIRLNRDMYVLDCRSVTYNGQTLTVPFPGSNFHALTTALHEDIHAWQMQVINGEIEVRDPMLQREYAANNFDVVPLLQPDGTVKNGSTYLTGSSGRVGYYLYYFQATERDAHRFSEAKTAAIMDALAEKYGEEPSFAAYRAELRQNGYEATLTQARELLGNSAPEREISQSIMRAYYGIAARTDPQLEAMVREEMAASYAQLHGRLAAPIENKKLQEGNTMALRTHVSAGEFDQTLRNAVNAYYEHAMNSPEMSQEEAIQSTAEMAEAYLTEVEAFETAQAAETAALEEGGLDDGGGGGLDDGGMDGGGLE